MTTTDHIVCSRCERALPPGEFSPRRDRPLGRASHCKECDRERKQAYRTANRELVRAQDRALGATVRTKARKRAWRTANPDAVKEYSQRWRELHPEQFAAIVEERTRSGRSADNSRRWRQRYPERHAEQVRRRRAKQAGLTVVPPTTAGLAAKWRFWAGRCWVCGVEATAWDHVKPIAKGGGHMLCNLRPICRPCNSAKRDRWPWRKAA